MAAATAGLLYAFGAIEAVSQLHREEVDALNALPLIPLEQILGRGIWVAVDVLPLLIVPAVIGVFFTEGIDRWRAGSSPSEKPPMGARIVPGAIFCLALAFLALTVASRELARYAVTIVIAGVALLLTSVDVRPPMPPAHLVFVGVVFAIAFAISGALITPDRLPHVKLQLKSGKTTEGAFLTNDGGRWYVIHQRTIDSYRDDDVRSAAVTAVRMTPQKSLIERF